MEFGKKFKKNGYLIVDQILSENQVNDLRKDLHKEFKERETFGIYLHNVKNKSLASKILLLLKNEKLKSQLNSMKNFFGKSATLLPRFQIIKNYHVNLKETHGWHRDCEGEMKYGYCRDILYNKKYLFSKVGIYLQENNDFGGSIDIIKNSHLNYSYHRSFIRKIKNIPFLIIHYIHSKLNNFYIRMSENFFMFFLNGKKLFQKKGSAIIFDTRLIHRGSPISKSKYGEVKFKKGTYQASLNEKNDKYTIYCHFGSSESVDSLMYDLTKKQNNKKEMHLWLEQMKFISTLDKELYIEMNKIIEPISEKYL